MNMRLNSSNLGAYLVDAYGCKNQVFQEAPHIIEATPLLQSNYGGDMDCSLVSILTILKQRNPGVTENDLPYHYDLIERIAKRYFYKDTIGTLPIFISGIMKKIFNIPVVGKYGKGIGFNFKSIKKQLDKNNLVILSMWNDGRDIYKKHSVIVAGYQCYKIDGKDVRLLAIYDNWAKEIRYIDYKKLSIISSIHYLNAPVTQLDRV